MMKIAYGRLIASKETDEYLLNLCKELGLKDIQKEFHITCLYTPGTEETLEKLIAREVSDLGVQLPVKAKFKSFRLFGNTLVLELECKEATGIFNQLKLRGAKWKHKEFIVHCSLSYNCDKIPDERISIKELVFDDYKAEYSNDDISKDDIIREHTVQKEQKLYSLNDYFIQKINEKYQDYNFGY